MKNHTVLFATHTCNPRVEWAIPTCTPPLQSVTALWLILISHSAEDRRLSWPRWLIDYVPRWYSNSNQIAPRTGRLRAHAKQVNPVPWCPYTESQKNVFSFLRHESIDRSSFRSVSTQQPVPWMYCRNRESSVTDSSTCANANSADRAGMSATGVSESRDIFCRVSQKQLMV